MQRRLQLRDLQGGRGDKGASGYVLESGCEEVNYPAYTPEEGGTACPHGGAGAQLRHTRTVVLLNTVSFMSCSMVRAVEDTRHVTGVSTGAPTCGLLLATDSFENSASLTTLEGVLNA